VTTVRAPKGLNATARAAWRQLVGVLQDQDRWHPGLAPLVELAAVALGRAREARELVEAQGLIVDGARGPVRNPASVAEHQAAIEARRCLAALGLDGEGVEAEVEDELSPADQVLARMAELRERGRDRG
jgi:P27 family predicted phage terminase small subunit